MTRRASTDAARFVSERSGLSIETCRELLNADWVYAEYSDGPRFWLAGGWDALTRIEIREKFGKDGS